jgi:hypothetical protein
MIVIRLLFIIKKGGSGVEGGSSDSTLKSTSV